MPPSRAPFTRAAAAAALLAAAALAAALPRCALGRALQHGRALAQGGISGGGRPGGLEDDTPVASVNTTREAELLLAFKASLDNGDEILTNWRPGSDPCAWLGISCGAQGEVTSLVLLDKGLVGTIPSPRGWVLPPNIKDISLGNTQADLKNKIYGPIPPGWELPPALELLFLGFVPLGGTLSADWQLPAGLQYFLFESSNLTGPLPNGWRLPPTLISVNLYGNELRGTIPPEFTTIPSLASMSLQNNQLTGTIPAQFMFNSSFDINGVGLAGNNMSGPVPSWPDYPISTVGIRPGNEGLCINNSDGKLPAHPVYTDASTAANIPVPELPLCPGVTPASTASSGLSGGAIAGIAIGGVAVAAAVLAGAALLLRRRRQQLGAAVGASVDNGKLDSTKLTTPNSSSLPSISGSYPLNPFSSGPTLSSRSSSLPLTALRAKDSSESGATAEEQARLQAKLVALERENPSWLISASRLSLDQGSDGRLVLLGSGAYGRVYKGWLLPAWAAGEEPLGSDCDTGRSLEPAIPVAMKVMEVADVNAFLKEASVLQQLNGSLHTVYLHGACVTNQQLIVVMELLEGGDLRAALSGDSPPLWQNGGRQIALDIAAGLEWLHSRNVTHRDLKSKNVLLTRERRAKVADVGTAALHSATYLSAGSNYFGGTLAWAAPELLLAAPCTHKVDLYSYGVVLWEIVTGERPLRGDLRAPRVPEECPQEVADLIDACLSQAPAKRPSAAEVLQQLRAVQAPAQEGQDSDGAPPPQ